MPRYTPKKLEIYHRYCGKCGVYFETKAKCRGRDVKCKKCGGLKAIN